MSESDGRRVALPGGPFRIWRCACLRGTGFPASMLLRLGSQDAARAARAVHAAEDDVAPKQRAACAALLALKHTPAFTESARKALRLAQKGRPAADTGTSADDALRAFRGAVDRVTSASKDYDDVFVASRRRAFEAVQAVARDARFREAVTWQNRAAIETAFEMLARADPHQLRGKDRQHEALVVRYMQRYCAKNDTIGFFGPVGWARWTDDEAAIVVTPARELLAARAVYFEQWPIDAVARKATDDTRLAAWRIPRRLPFVTLDGTRAESAAGGRHELSPAEASLLEACDGVRTTRALAREGRWGDEGDVALELDALREKNLVVWGFEVPLTWNPEDALARRLEVIDDEVLRTEALSVVEELRAARAKVAAAAGDVDALAVALRELETTFTTATGVAATRQAGASYAGRQIVFEDCRRGGEVALGQRLLDALGPPLSLVLTSARWFTYEVARTYRAALRARFEDLAKKDGTPVSFLALWLRAQPLFFGARERPLDAVVAELERRWADVLAVPAGIRHVAYRSDDLRARVEEVFAAPGTGWTAARHHSPDVLVAAESVEAIARDEYELVLGELHVAVNTLDTQLFLAQHPDVRDVHEAFAGDLPEPRIVPVSPKDWPGTTVRTNSPLVTPTTTLLETGVDAADAPRDRVVAASDLVVVDRDGELVVTLREGARTPVSFAPLELIDFLGQMLTPVACSAFRIRSGSARAPRITIDRLVVCREAWTFAPSTMPFADVPDEARMFLEARRWAAEQELPRFVFVKSALEPKPLYFDLESAPFVSMLAKVARAAREHAGGEKPLAFTEMMPGLDRSWFADAAGERYTTEIRTIAVD